jgi:hypothetical protein
MAFMCYSVRLQIQVIRYFTLITNRKIEVKGKVVRVLN